MSKCDKDNLNILLAEDNSDHRELLKQAIRSANKGYIIDEAEDGQACIKKLKEKEYNALLLDYSLPEKNGLEILREVKESGLDLPVIMLTGLGAEKIASEAVNLGAEGYVIKEGGYGEKIAIHLSYIIERKKAEKELRQNQKRLQKSERNLKKFCRRLLTIREEEKKKLSIDLHDELISMVVDLSSNLDIAEEDLKNSDMKSALKNIRRTRLALKSAVNKLKRIAVDLMPPHLDTVGLGEVLRDYILNIRNKIKENIAIAVYRVVQESLNNIIEHAKAKKARIRLFLRNNKLNISISDDGKGFNTKKLQDLDGMKMGIRGMRERVEEIGGEFSIKSVPKQGTKINISV